MRFIMEDGSDITAPEPLPIDIVMMERKYGIGAGVFNDPTQQRVEYALFLAWHAQKRIAPNTVPPVFDDFLKGLHDYEADEDPTEDGQQPIQNEQ